MPTKSRSFRLGEMVVHGITPAIYRLTWEGERYVPAEGGVLVVANHISHADPFVIAQFLTRIGRLPRFLAKDALFDVPVVGSVLSKAGQIPVVRESADAVAALGAARDAIAAGECVVIYPEGTLTRDPDLWPMRGKLGPARLALDTGCPVIPVGQWGSQDLLPGYAKVPRLHRRPRVRLLAGPPVDLSMFEPPPGEVPGVRDLLRATAAITADITALVARLRGEDPPTHVWNPKQHGQSSTGDPRRSPTSGTPRKPGTR